MARFRLTPQKREFFDLYCRAAANTREITRLLCELLEGWPESRDALTAIRAAEHVGDSLTHDVINLLNGTFVTPFDRDDMYRLATVLDDICDHVDEAADNIDAYEVTEVPALALEQARVVHRAASYLQEAVEALEGFNITTEQLMAVRGLEDDGDRLSREAVAELFRSGADALTIIRWKGGDPRALGADDRVRGGVPAPARDLLGVQVADARHGESLVPARPARLGTFVAFTHGANDAQKTMGVIALALYSHGQISSFYIPDWVKITVGLAIAAGTYSGGWRIMRTMGQRVYKLEPESGFAAQATAGAVIWASTKAGYPLSTTHVVSGGVMGVGSTKRFSAVKWGSRRKHRHRVGADAAGRGARGGAPLLPDPGDLLKLGVGSGSSEMFALLAEAGENAHRIAQAVEQRFREYPGGPVTQDEVKRLEHEGDRIVSDLLRSVDAQFVTPYDRQDIVTLAFAVDEVPDKIENASELLGLYGVAGPTRQSLDLCGCLVEATAELAKLLTRLKGLRGWAPEILAVKEIEDRADDLARAARAGLFKDDRIDPVLVIRWKGIYEALEDAVDACDTAAARVGNILVKNA